MKAKIKTLLQNAKTQEALELLSKYLPDAGVLLATFNEAKNRNDFGRLKYELFAEEQAKVTHTALYILKNWDGNTGDQKESSWESFFCNLPLKKNITIAPLLTVNADRHDHYTKQLLPHFKKHKSKTENLVYFICACPKQKPSSIAKRLVYFFDEEFPVFLTSPDQPEDLEVIDLKIKASETGTWKEFWKVFQDRFLKESIDFENFVKNASKWLQNSSRIPLAFEVEENVWNDVTDIHEHVRFIIEKFEELPGKYRKFVFFFIFQFSDLHGKRSQTCQCYLDELKNVLTFEDISPEEFHKLPIYKLPPVWEEDVKTWANSYLKPVEVDLLISELRRTHSINHKRDVQYDMIMVEKMQEALYAYLSKQNPSN